MFTQEELKILLDMSMAVNVPGSVVDKFIALQNKIKSLINNVPNQAVEENTGNTVENQG